MTPPRACAVVLAGGGSRRFGADKLNALVHGESLLDVVVGNLPPDAEVIVVGPARAIARPARFVREDPPGGGPAAALVAGLRIALTGSAAEFATVPGDAPESGRAIGSLLATLRAEGVDAVVATDQNGFEQPLQLALTRTGAEALIAAAGPTGAAGQSARALLSRLDPAAIRQPTDAASLRDIDTRDDLTAWLHRP